MGDMKTGWYLEGGRVYYFLSIPDDHMYNDGWALIDSKWYYFYSNGAMAQNVTIDGYKIGTDGARF
jgi:glucan-binding YG repeat protein